MFCTFFLLKAAPSRLFVAFMLVLLLQADPSSWRFHSMILYFHRRSRSAFSRSCEGG